MDRIFQIGNIALSAFVASADKSPRATVLALPGGSYTKSYWHDPLLPDLSLLDLGPKLGFNVIALDRPGYGASANLDPAWHSYERQTDVMVALIETLPALVDLGAGVFLIGHSMGGCISLEVGARQRSPSLLGIDISGVPFRYRPELAQAVAAALPALESGMPLDMEAATTMFYGPADTYDPRVRQREKGARYRGSATELKASLDWPERFPAVAGRVNVPTQLTLGEFEVVTPNDWDSLNEMGSLFRSAPRVVLQCQRGAGHNVSHHHVGRAYHMRAFAFFEECLALGAGRR